MLARFLGYVQSSMQNDGIRESDIEAMVERDKFSDYLPYRAYDSTENYYTCADDGIGLLWEIQPLVYASKESHEKLEKIFKVVPMGTVVQVILYADPHIDQIIDSYLGLRKEQTNKILSEKTAELFKNASRHGFSNMSRIPARTFRGFFCVKLPEKQGFDTDTRHLRDTIHGNLASCGLLPKHMEPQKLCETLQKVFNDQDNTPTNWTYNDQLPINKQIIMGGTRIFTGHNHITFGEEKLLNIQTLKDYPQESLDDLTMNKVIGGFMGSQDDGDQCNMPFFLSVNIVVEDLRHLFHGKSTMMMQQEKKGSGASFKMDRQNEMLSAARETDRGNRFVRVIPTVISFAKNKKEGNQNTARIKRLWENQGFTVNRDKGILGPLFLLSLPLGFYNTKNNIEFLERDRIMPVQSAVRMLPLQGDYAGCGKPVSIFIGRKGQIVPLDLYDPMAVNSNLIITATSGSGKSYLMNQILSDQLSTGTILRVFDLGRSYEKLSQIQDGKFISFNKESKICVNPYTTIRNIDEEIGILGVIISQMVWSSTNQKPLETQMTIIKTAARQVWDDYGNEGQVDYVRKVLQDFEPCLQKQNFELGTNTEKIKELAGELAFNLGDFTGEGPYARWFRGKSTLDIKHDRFVVLELEELIAMQELFNVVIMQVVNSVAQDLYLSTRENTRTIVFDEAWKWFTEGSFLGEVVENGYRLARKYYGSFITIFQSMLDLQKFGKSGNVINENSAFKAYLMAKTKYDKVVKEQLVDFDPFMLKMANSLRLEKGSYSEFLLQTSQNTGIARLPIDKFKHLVFTSDARENIMINNTAKEMGVSKIEAIEALCRKEK